MKKLKLMCDYFCYPIWHNDGATTGEFGDIDPRMLPISPALADELMAWSDWFDRGLDMDDPASSRWATGEREEFVRVGRQLLEKVQVELGTGFAVRGSFEGPALEARGSDGPCPCYDIEPAGTGTGAFSKWWWFLGVITAILFTSFSARGR